MVAVKLESAKRGAEMNIDEAIKNFRYDAENNRADLDLEFAKKNEQVAKWLEKLNDSVLVKHCSSQNPKQKQN